MEIKFKWEYNLRLETMIPKDRKWTASQLIYLNDLLKARKWNKLESALDPEITGKSNMLIYLYATPEEYELAMDFLKDRLEWRTIEKPLFEEGRDYLKK